MKTIQYLIQALSRMKTAIYLLIIIAVVSAAGTLVPQGNEPVYYLQHYGEELGKFIQWLGMDDLYRVWWYQAMMGLLCLSLLICSYRRLKVWRTLQGAASLLLHFGMVVIIIGAVWSLGYAHSSYIEIAEGESASLQEYGFESGSLFVKDFAIEYYPDFEPRQYQTELALQGYKGRNYHQNIAVNHPLKAGVLKIYQTSWGWLMDASVEIDGLKHNLRLQDGGRLSLPGNADMQVHCLFIPDYQEGHARLESVSPLPNNPRMWLTILSEGKIVDMTILAPGEEHKWGTHSFTFDRFMHYTGLTVKEDKGVYMVFAGFLMIIIGLLGRYWKELLDRKAV